MSDGTDNEDHNVRYELLASVSGLLSSGPEALLGLAFSSCCSHSVVVQYILSESKTRSNDGIKNLEVHKTAHGGKSREGGGPSYGGASSSVGAIIPDVSRTGMSASRLFPIPAKLTLILRKY